jgi:TonB family protein
MSQQPAPQKRPPNTVDAVLAYSKRFLFYGFAISIVLHGIFGPFVNWKPMESATPEPIQTVTVTKVVTPKPTATPTPPPSPTPTPVTHTAPPQTPPPQPKLLVHPPKQTSQNQNGPSENAYTNKVGSESGIPQGTANSAPPATAPPPAAPSPSPTATKPACANPNADAVATQKVTPDMPEIARQMGATGTAQIKVTLDAKGNVTAVSVYKSTNNRALDQAALQAAQQSRYSPQVKDCVAVAGSYLYVVTFESQ